MIHKIRSFGVYNMEASALCSCNSCIICFGNQHMSALHLGYLSDEGTDRTCSADEDIFAKLQAAAADIVHSDGERLYQSCCLHIDIVIEFQEPVSTHLYIFLEKSVVAGAHDLHILTQVLAAVAAVIAYTAADDCVHGNLIADLDIISSGGIDGINGSAGFMPHNERSDRFRVLTCDDVHIGTADSGVLYTYDSFLGSAFGDGSLLQYQFLVPWHVQS